MSESFIFEKIFYHGFHGFHGWKTRLFPSVPSVKSVVALLWLRLAEDYVFITDFDDLYFIKDKDKANITDHDLCSFLVALTKARKRV